MSTSKIKEGDQIIIKTAKVLKVFQARKNRVIRVEKTKFTLDDAIGAFYGSTFEAKGGRLVRIDNTAKDDNMSADKESERDNRNLKDTAENQKLKKEDIQALRKGGASGHDIVDKLVVNSSTFKEKTEFAQEKYIKKKKKKHVTEFTILRPNTRLLAKLYFSKGPTKMCNLRYDAIAQILTQANIHSGCKLMIFESVIGLLVGAVLERLGGKGELVQFYTGSAPARQAMEPYNFSAEVKKCLLSFPLDQVSSLSRDSCKCCPAVTKDVNKSKEHPNSCCIKSEDNSSNGEVPLKSAATSVDCAVMDVVKREINEENESETQEIGREEKMETLGSQKDGTNTQDERGTKRKLEWDAEKERRRQHRQAELYKSRELLETADLDGLIVASKWHPTPIVMSLIDFVAPSRPVVIFSQYKEPLLDCYVKLRNRGGVVSMRMSETWLRNYQVQLGAISEAKGFNILIKGVVLPNRTHPEINMSAAGGYLLTGTTVIMDRSATEANNS